MPEDTSDNNDSTELESLNGVGPERAEDLRDAGYPDVESLAGATDEDLMAVDGIGDDIARDILDAVEASDVDTEAIADFEGSDTDDYSTDETADEDPVLAEEGDPSAEPSSVAEEDATADADSEGNAGPVVEPEETADADSSHTDGTTADHSTGDAEPSPEAVSTQPVDPDVEDGADAEDAATPGDETADYVRLSPNQEYVCAGLWVDDPDTERPVVRNTLPVQEAVREGRAEVVDTFSADEVTVQTE